MAQESTIRFCLHAFGTADGDDEPKEIAECDMGLDSVCGGFRDTIARRLGARQFPTLMQHSYYDGEWTLPEVAALSRELREIGAGQRGQNIQPAQTANEANVGSKSAACIFNGKAPRDRDFLRLADRIGGFNRSV